MSCKWALAGLVDGITGDVGTSEFATRILPPAFGRLAPMRNGVSCSWLEMPVHNKNEFITHNNTIICIHTKLYGLVQWKQVLTIATWRAWILLRRSWLWIGSGATGWCYWCLARCSSTRVLSTGTLWWCICIWLWHFQWFISLTTVLQRNRIVALKITE